MHNTFCEKMTLLKKLILNLQVFFVKSYNRLDKHGNSNNIVEESMEIISLSQRMMSMSLLQYINISERITR